MIRSLISLWLSVLLICACAQIPTTEITATEAQLSSPTIPVATTASPKPSPTVTSTEILPADIVVLPRQICSPFKDIELDQIPGLVSNPYHPPAPGSDDPHHGVDLSVQLPGSDMAVTGHPIQAVLAGQVAMVLNDRFPYGNAVLIETTLDGQFAEGLQGIEIPTPAPTLAVTSALTCPSISWATNDLSNRSVYLLYAHLLNPVVLRTGEQVTCGQVIGAVGSSGNALNPHLHFEMRVGPSGSQFPGMAHYDNSASAEEMGIYCLWRISGLYQLIDPLKIFSLPVN